ncbi:peptidoglycan bridge formation glycyltransferase FemA/FemB family protein [bacterium]|nr:peptidoglycan bridge formation glycyltransferase FemA/FemB family protein [bacterium]
MTVSSGTFKLTNSPDSRMWEKLLAESPHSTVFHTPEIYTAFKKTKNHAPLVYAAEKDGEIMAMLNPVLITLKSGLFHPVTTRAIEYGGPVYRETGTGRQAFSELLKWYVSDIRKSALFTDIRNLTDPAAIAPLLDQAGFVKEPHINYWIRLDRPLDEVWNHFTKSARRNVRQAEKKGVRYVRMTDRGLLPEFYKNLQFTFVYKNTPLVDYSLFENIFDVLVPKNLAQFYLAEIEGAYFASFLVLLHKHVIYLWYSADNFKMRHYYPTDGFIWHILKWGHEHGYRNFDFGWAGRLDQPYGVRQFKEKFGGDMIEFGRHVLVHKPLLLQISKTGYQVSKGFGLFHKLLQRLGR